MKNFSVGLLSIVMLMACCITNSMGDEVITIGQRKLGDEIVFAVSDRTESTPQPSEKTLKFYSQYVRPTYFTITVKPSWGKVIYDQTDKYISLVVSNPFTTRFEVTVVGYGYRVASDQVNTKNDGAQTRTVTKDGPINEMKIGQFDK